MSEMLHYVWGVMSHFFHEAEFWMALVFAVIVYVSFKPVAKGLKVAMQVRAVKIENRLSEAARLHRDAYALLEKYRRRAAGIKAESEALMQDGKLRAIALRDEAALRIEETEAAMLRRCEDHIAWNRREFSASIGAEVTDLMFRTLTAVLAATPLPRTDAAAYNDVLSTIKKSKLT